MRGFAHKLPRAGPRNGRMSHIRNIIRPIVKTLIVNHALRGRITPSQAERLIAAFKLRGA